MKKLLLILSIVFMSCEKEEVIIKRNVVFFGLYGSGQYECEYTIDGNIKNTTLAAHQQVLLTLKSNQTLHIRIYDGLNKEMKLTVRVDNQNVLEKYGTEINYVLK